VSIKFYDDNAESFFTDTVNVDLNAIYQHFLPKLSRNAHILDAGCGSGRDSKYFIEQGYKVTAFDASEVLAQKASEYVGISVSTNTFENFNGYLTPLNKQSFDAIWACASLLHVTSSQLPNAFTNLANQLKFGGIFYCSFKYGDNDIERNGRYFTNADEQRLTNFINKTGLTIESTWLTADARPDRQDEKWLNAILIKQ
jgi:SAM-dependent methyltransferase